MKSCQNVLVSWRIEGEFLPTEIPRLAKVQQEAWDQRNPLLLSLCLDGTYKIYFIHYERTYIRHFMDGPTYVRSEKRENERQHRLRSGLVNNCSVRIPVSWEKISVLFQSHLRNLRTWNSSILMVLLYKIPLFHRIISLTNINAQFFIH